MQISLSATIAAGIDTSVTVVGKANTSDVLTKWKLGTADAIGDRVVSPNGDTVTAMASFASGATYSGSNWSLPVATVGVPKSPRPAALGTPSSPPATGVA